MHGRRLEYSRRRYLRTHTMRLMDALEDEETQVVIADTMSTLGQPRPMTTRGHPSSSTKQQTSDIRTSIP